MSTKRKTECPICGCRTPEHDEQIHEAMEQEIERDEAIKGKPGIAGIPARLKCARELRRMTQKRLASKVKLTAAHISHFECGQRLPSVPNLRALAIALNTSADWLLDS